MALAAPAVDAALHDEDADLMLAYAAGDAAAFDALYARHKGGVYRYLLRHCGQRGIADELFQDVWTNVIRSRASYRPAARFATWLYRIAHNRVIDHWRASGVAHAVVAAETDDPDVVEAVPAPAHGEPDRQATANEIRERLERALATLPAAQRDAFLLHYEADLSLAEIATMTDAGVETVKSRLRYATGRLRAMLGDLR